MKVHHSFASGSACLCVLILASIVSAADADGPKGVDEAWMKAMKANDLNAVVACYAADAIGWFPGEAHAKGTEAIKAAYKRLLDANTVTDAKMADGVYKAAGDRGMSWGTFAITLTPKNGGAAMTMTGRFTAVYEKRDGRWVYIVDHASAEPPPAVDAGK